MDVKNDEESSALTIELGRVIAARRTRLRLKQTDVALATGISIATYRRYEDTGPVRIPEAFAIARALRVPLSELVREAEAGVVAMTPTRRMG